MNENKPEYNEEKILRIMEKVQYAKPGPALDDALRRRGVFTAKIARWPKWLAWAATAAVVLFIFNFWGRNWDIDEANHFGASKDKIRDLKILGAFLNGDYGVKIYGETDYQNGAAILRMYYEEKNNSIVTLDIRNNMRMWNAETGEEMLSRHAKDAATPVAVSENGQFMASWKDTKLEILNIRDDLVSEFELKATQGIGVPGAFSYNGETFATAILAMEENGKGQRSTDVSIFDLKGKTSRTISLKLDFENESVSQFAPLAFSDDGSNLYLACGPQIRMIDAKDGAEFSTLIDLKPKGRNENLFIQALAPIRGKDKLLMLAQFTALERPSEGRLILLDLKTKECKELAEKPNYSVVMACMTPDEKKLFLSSNTGRIRVLDFANGSENVVKKPAIQPLQICGKDALAYLDTEGFGLLNLNTGEAQQSCGVDFIENIGEAVVSPNGKLLMLYRSGNLELIDVDSKKKIADIGPQGYNFLGYRPMVFFDADSNPMIGKNEGLPEKWDYKSGKPIGMINPEGPVLCEPGAIGNAVFLHWQNGCNVVLKEYRNQEIVNRTVKNSFSYESYDITTGKLFAKFETDPQNPKTMPIQVKRFPQGVQGTAFSSSGQFVIMVREDSSLDVFDTKTGKTIWSEKFTQDGKISAVTIDENAFYFADSFGNIHIRKFSAPEKDKILVNRLIKDEKGAGYPIHMLYSASEGKYLVALNASGTLTCYTRK